MLIHSRRRELRDAFWALLFALWCMAWPAGFVSVAGKTPGFISLRGNAGLREVFEAFIPLSYKMALFAWGVVAFAVMWVVLRLWRWLDPQAQTMAAIRWALSGCWCPLPWRICGRCCLRRYPLSGRYRLRRWIIWLC
jgi:hypothetical protein